ncbi:MAG: hypothetical protein WC968_00820 [Bacilli bacterium]
MWQDTFDFGTHFSKLNDYTNLLETGLRDIALTFVYSFYIYLKKHLNVSVIEQTEFIGIKNNDTGRFVIQLVDNLEIKINGSVIIGKIHDFDSGDFNNILFMIFNNIEEISNIENINESKNNEAVGVEFTNQEQVVPLEKLEIVEDNRTQIELFVEPGLYPYYMDDYEKDGDILTFDYDDYVDKIFDEDGLLDDFENDREVYSLEELIGVIDIYDFDD